MVTGTNLRAAFHQLYVSHWPVLAAICAEHELQYAPFLMNPPELYEVQSPRLLIVGQEGNEWCQGVTDGLDAEKAVSALMDSYLSWDFGLTYRSSPFWQAVREVEIQLGVPSGQILWTNLNKLAPKKGPPSQKLVKALLQRASLLQPEIELAKPDIAVFFSGPNYDLNLGQALPGVEFVAVDGSPGSNVFCRLVHPSLPKLSFRTYHPSGLRQLRQWIPVMDLFKRQFETWSESSPLGTRT